jgi:phosphoglucosamine mutase
MGKNDNNTRHMFGTDGVRDIANSGYMTPETVMSLGRAYVSFIRDKTGKDPIVAVGRDTRVSGSMLQSALMAGIASAGGSGVALGVIPTPGVSHAILQGKFDGGAVISASHNPAEYNGVKFMDSKGFKLSDEDELSIEKIFYNFAEDKEGPKPIGGVSCKEEYGLDYAGFLSDLMSGVQDTDYHVVVDAANGAASDFVTPIFGKWKGRVDFYGKDPDGFNINRGVGVTHMNFICSKTKERGAKLGVAFDGDTDRVLICDGQGRIIDGDIMLWVIARWLKKMGKLGSGVVATVMSNMVLRDLLAKEGIDLFRCDVGDRYVLSRMQEKGCRIGGEQSGHIIALDYANTGDGLCSMILFLKALSALGEDSATLADRFDRYPQVLRNIKVSDKKAVMNDSEVLQAAADAEKLLENKGRVLLRPSGTEPVIRIFVEAKDAEMMNNAADIMEKKIVERFANHQS